MGEVAAIVLAAGASTRMGRPKAEVEYGGVRAIDRIVGACQEAGVGDVVVVVGAHAVECEARVVANPAWTKGRTGSLQVGLRAVEARRVVVWPVDHPLATSGSVSAILAAQGEWVVPTWGGRGGHPILLAGRALEAVRGAEPTVALRDALRGSERVEVPVPDEGVELNLDEPGWGPGI